MKKIGSRLQGKADIKLRKAEKENKTIIYAYSAEKEVEI